MEGSGALHDVYMLMVDVQDTGCCIEARNRIGVGVAVGWILLDIYSG